ncbi:PREDICTED: uncharacterized protein LOC109212458 [Nicotiana attenuata]|uniref:uncharacterized protein LOC109212458 n=1 Tax=Nicotiana attenuata TaxID=49451 RepID=UPI0009058099|nr:PREDICTED: uncharacterized protein LOC109212458 [Nicotiana attenuata]
MGETDVDPKTPIVVGTSHIFSSPSQQVDPCHPYFLTSSDNPGVNLININFDGTSYANWRRGVLISLTAKNKLGFINGSFPCPSSDSPLIDQWQRCNDMVISWLLNSLSRDIAESVIYSQTAEELWNELEERYGQADGTKLFQLQRELNNISQGTSDMAGYFTKLKRIWDQMKVLNTFMICNWNCKCGAKTHNVKINEDQKLIQLLMGLNDAYSGVRANILMMKPLPSTAQAYSILLHQESQREVHSNSSSINDSTAFMTSGQKWNAQRTTSQLISAIMLELRRMICTANTVKKPGHVKEEFYKLVGYPQHFKVNKQRRGTLGNQQANMAIPGRNLSSGMAGESVSTLVGAQGFTKEQCDQLIQMFQSLQGTPTASSESIGAANLAGMKLSNVLHVPDFNHNLLSVSQFVSDMNYDLLFTKAGCILQAPLMRKEPLFGETTAGLYVLKDDTSTLGIYSIKSPISASFSSSSRRRLPGSLSSDSESVCERTECHVLLSPVYPANLNENINMNVSVSNDVMNVTDSNKLWHFCLGHLPYDAMKHIKAIQVTSTNNNKFPCEVCPMARQSKPPFTKSTIRSKNYFDLIHIDTWGPYNTPTYKGEKYFLTVVDDFSRST